MFHWFYKILFYFGKSTLKLPNGKTVARVKLNKKQSYDEKELHKELCREGVEAAVKSIENGSTSNSFYFTTSNPRAAVVVKKHINQLTRKQREQVNENNKEAVKDIVVINDCDVNGKRYD